MAIRAALSFCFGTLNVIDGMHGRTVRDITARSIDIVAFGTFTVWDRQRLTAGNAADMAVGASYSAGVFIMILGAWTFDVQAVIRCSSMNRQRIPDGLFKRVTQDAVRSGSLGYVTD